MSRERIEPRHPDDVDIDRAEAGDQAPPDARKGREYQGSGIPNRHGRYGSSQTPEDLEKERAQKPGGKK